MGAFYIFYDADRPLTNARQLSLVLSPLLPGSSASYPARRSLLERLCLISSVDEWLLIVRQIIAL
ncbi:hypothetical protein [Microcoleus vaginatus]|uniref:hypothetical protein n=1 Tax=Microcoleus vaginatus TaxID=119532 RepID=UPI0002E7F467